MNPSPSTLNAIAAYLAQHRTRAKAGRIERTRKN